MPWSPIPIDRLFGFIPIGHAVAGCASGCANDVSRSIRDGGGLHRDHAIRCGRGRGARVAARRG